MSDAPSYAQPAAFIGLLAGENFGQLPVKLIYPRKGQRHA